MLVFVKKWRETLSSKLGFKRGKAGRAYSCPWWADEAAYTSAFIHGKGVEISAANRAIEAEYHRPLEIIASTAASDYEIVESPYWPPPPKPPAPPLSPEEQAQHDERIRGASFLIVLPCWVFHKNDPDPWPSTLHGHHSERPLKLDAITGFIYNIKTREHVQSLRQKALLPIQTKLLASKDFGERARSLLTVP